MRYTSATSTSDWPARVSVVSGDVSVLAQQIEFGAQRRGQKHSQGPKQVLGAAPMQAICEE
jgi:hypothetical protein